MTLVELNNSFEICKDQLAAIGFKQVYINKYKVEFNTRAKRRLGRCSKVPDGSYLITINNTYADLNPKKAKETIMHELIHSLDGCLDHGDKWKKVVNMVNRKYGYSISRCTDAGNDYKEQAFERTYMVKCAACGRETSRERISKVIQHPELYKCGLCGGKLERIK